jgi:hypothetical protein
MEHHGWSDLADELHVLSAEGRWQEMTRLVPDHVVSEFTIEATYDELPEAYAAKFGGLIDSITIVPELKERLGLPLASPQDQAKARDIIERFHAIPTPSVAP